MLSVIPLRGPLLHSSIKLRRPQQLLRHTPPQQHLLNRGESTSSRGALLADDVVAALVLVVVCWYGGGGVAAHGRVFGMRVWRELIGDFVVASEHLYSVFSLFGKYLN